MSQVLLREAELELKQLLVRQQEVPPTDSALQAEPVGRSDEAVAATESSRNFTSIQIAAPHSRNGAGLQAAIAV